MTTSALEQEAVDQGAVPFPPYSWIEFSPFEYQKVVVYLSGEQEFDNRQIDYALERYWHGHLKNNSYLDEYGTPPQQPQGGAQPPQQQRQAPQRGSGQQGRSDRFQPIDDWQCDNCGGPCGTMETKNGSIAVKCLGTCKDGQYVHTVGWV